MARAAAPMFRGFRGATRTTRKRSDSGLLDKEEELKAEKRKWRKQEKGGEPGRGIQKDALWPWWVCVGGEGKHRLWAGRNVKPASGAGSSRHCMGLMAWPSPIAPGPH